MQAHHALPQKFIEQFQRIDPNLNIHDPKYGAWWDKMIHLKRSEEFAADWAKFLKEPNLTRAGIESFGRTLAEKYGFPINF